MRRFMLLGIGLTGLAALLACGGVFGGDRPVADACTEMFQKFTSTSPSNGMLRDCEVFYTDYASEEQKAQLQCIAAAWTEEEARDCENVEKKFMGNPDAGEGPKARIDEGKVGKRAAKMDKDKGNIPKGTRVVLGTLLDLNCQPAPSGSVLGVLREGGQMDGSGGAIDSNLMGGIGALIGAKGTQIGSGGPGSRGSGVGGGDPIILGDLDRSLIDEVVKRHMKAIRYCYQRELTKSPNLKGKVVVKFVVTKDGTVSSASKKSSTIKNAGVESCVVSRFKPMQFPKPKGGGIVIISYPLVFSPG